MPAKQNAEFIRLAAANAKNEDWRLWEPCLSERQWDYVLFHEHFHGDTARGIGASHQAGRTGRVAKLLQPRKMKSNDAPSRSAKGSGTSHVQELIEA